MFPPNTYCKVRLNAETIKPFLRGQSCQIIRVIDDIAPFHYLVRMSDQTENVFAGDELDYDHKQSQTKFTAFTDKRGRTWEWFIDESYYYTTCVRLKGETDFNSQLSFHFNTSDIALNFVKLLKQST